MALDPPAAGLGGTSYTPPSPSVAALRSVLFHPGYHIVLTRGRRIVVESSIQGTAMGGLPVRAILGPVGGRIEGTTSVFRSRWNNHYHTLIDNLPRLHLLHHDPAAQEPEIQVLIGDALTEVEHYIVPRILPTNARVVSLPPGRPWLTDKLLLPGFLSRRFAGYLPPDYLEWFLERVAPPRPSRRDGRILISRKRTSHEGGRFIENEDEVFGALQPLGFRRYTLDALPVAEQIELFHDADVVVGAHGAGLANSIFSRGAHVVELFPASFVTPHYYFLSKACGHAYRHLCGTAADRNANFTVSVPALLRTLGEAGV